MKNSTASTTPAAAAEAEAEAGYSRLHITPFDPQLLKVVVPAAVLPLARRISYHTLQTHPERPYGFVDLPTEAAEKIKKKLNGAVLRGTKIRVEPARPDYIPAPIPDAIIMTEAEAAAKTKRSSKTGDKKHQKRKRDAQELVGVELEEGRKVKRGWTVTPEEALAKKRKEKDEARNSKKSKSQDKDDKNKEKRKKRRDPESKYSDLPECLVKTHLPPNKVENATGERKKSKKGSKNDVVVHEFEKNTKFASFLKTAPSTSEASATEGAGANFVEGKGWVDKQGNVLEKVKSTKPTAFPRLAITREDDTTSSSGSSASEESDEDEDEDEKLGNQQTQGPPNLAKLTSPVRPTTSTATADESPRPRSAGSIRSLMIKIPSTPVPVPIRSVHPLEALYKRQEQQEQQDTMTTASAAKPSTEAEPFTFFSGADIDDEDEDLEAHGQEAAADEDDARPGTTTTSASTSNHLQPPMTPFTKQDYEWRNTRSAAPTPDTAHPSRVSRLWAPRDEDEDLILEEDEEEEEAQDTTTLLHAGSPAADHEKEGGATTTNPATDFEKWFWEHRGDLNRSWKKRRKLSAKEKRYRDNKARAEKAI